MTFSLFQILIWWFLTKVSPSNSATVIHCSRSGNSANATQNAAASLCDEIVTLWRLGALNPKLNPKQRQDMLEQFRDWHISSIEKVKKARNNSSSNASGSKKGDIENFSGFKPAIEACALTWDDYSIPGVTYSDTDGSRFYYYFGATKSHDGETKKASRVQPVTVCSQDIISTDNSSRNVNYPQRSQEIRGGRRTLESSFSPPQIPRRDSGNDGAVSSGSEGFCEPERGSRDSDSSGDFKGAHSRSNSFEDTGFPQQNMSLKFIPPTSSIDPHSPSSSTKSHSSSSPFSSSLSSRTNDPQSKKPVKEMSLEMDVFDDIYTGAENNAFDPSVNSTTTNDQPPSTLSSASGAHAPPLLSQAPPSSKGPPPSTSSSPSSSKTPQKNSSRQSATQASDSPSVSSNSQNGNASAQKQSDEYQIYFYDHKKAQDLDKRKKDKDEPNLFAGLRSPENMQDVCIVIVSS